MGNDKECVKNYAYKRGLIGNSPGKGFNKKTRKYADVETGNNEKMNQPGGKKAFLNFWGCKTPWLTKEEGKTESLKGPVIGMAFIPLYQVFPDPRTFLSDPLNGISYGVKVYLWTLNFYAREGPVFAFV